MPKRRLGVALLVPAPVAAEVDGLRRALGDGALGRIPAHLTLVPPVNVREEALGDALAVLREAAAETPPIEVTLGPVRTFHPTNPVLYLEVGGGGLGAVHALRDAVFRPPLERPLTWPFVPHVTVSDEVEPPERIDAGLLALGDYRTTVTFTAIALLQEGEGRVWSPIAHVDLAGRRVVGRGGLELEITSSASLDPEAAAFNDAAWSANSIETYGRDDHEEPFALAARRNGEVVGTATGASLAGEVYLGNLIVRSDERNTGVGSHLLAAVEALAAERGCHRLTLRTRADSPARLLYERRGWKAFVTLPRWRHGVEFVQMERFLS